MTEAAATPTPAEASAMSPEQASAKLAEMKIAFDGPPSDHPVAQLKRLNENPAWVAKLNVGHFEARADFDRLVQAAAKADPVEMAMSNILPELPTSELLQMNLIAGMFREIGLSEDVVKEFLSGTPTTQAIHDAAASWKTQHTKDAEFVKAYLSGDVEAVKLMTACAIVLTQEIAA